MKLNQTHSLFLLFVLSMVSIACDDSTKGKGNNLVQGDMGEEDQGGSDQDQRAGNMTITACFDDTSCAEDEYCLIENGIKGVCRSGCRDDSSCTDGRVCNPETKTCELPSCSQDNECPEGTYCDTAESICKTGCRLDSECVPAVDDSGRAIVCDPDTRACLPVVACCLANSDQCEALPANACSEQGGKALKLSLSCDNNPCARPACATDEECASLDGNGASYYCSEDLFCTPGCREDTCDGAQVCSPTTKACVDVVCSQRSDCGPNQYCSIDQICVIGCGQDSDCGVGLGCVNNQCVVRCDPNNPMSCADGQYCDLGSLICRNSCMLHADCNANEACIGNRCLANACRDDETINGITGEPNDTTDTATDLIDMPIAGEVNKFIAVASGKILCGQNTDFYRVSLQPGERMRISLKHSPNANLGFRLYEENSNTLINTINTINNPELPFDYPAEGIVADAHTYYIEVFSEDLEGINSATYELSVAKAPLGDACFSDINELNNDDIYMNATALIRNQVTTFDNLTLCANDVDWFMLPMNLNDGLTIDVRTPIASTPIRVEIYSAANLSAVANQTPKYTILLADSVEDGAERIYARSFAFDSRSFSDETYYIKVIGDTPNSYTSYRLSTEHQASANACNADAQEPNDTTNTGTDVVSRFNLMLDNNMLVPAGRDQRVTGNSICNGDIDYMCVSLGDQDSLSAWVVSDDVSGNLEVKIVTQDGTAVGTTARHSQTGQPFDKASYNGASAGKYCIQIKGIANSVGNYELYFNRAMSVGACGSDVGELMSRDDISSMAKTLAMVANNPNQYEYNGVICDINNQSSDQDWFKLPIAQANTKICASLTGFNNDRANLKLEVYGKPTAGTFACMNDNDCIARQLDACIEGTCQALRAQDGSDFVFNFENVLRGVNVGDNYLKVGRSAAGDAQSYKLTVSLMAPVNPQSPCSPDDNQELLERNNSSRFINGVGTGQTILGSGEIGFCDAYLCRDPNNASNSDLSDFYQINIPANSGDRTIYMVKDYDGGILRERMDLYAYAYDANFGDTLDIPGYAIGSLQDSYYQCINIKGGSMDANVEVGVRSVDLSVNRANYILKVVPTDLDVNPEGECGLLFGNNVELPCHDQCQNSNDCNPGQACSHEGLCVDQCMTDDQCLSGICDSVVGRGYCAPIRYASECLPTVVLP